MIAIAGKACFCKSFSSMGLKLSSKPRSPTLPALDFVKTAPAQQSRSFWLKQLHQWHWISSAIALSGLLFFAVMLVLCRPSLLRRRSTVLDVARLGFCGVGLLMALYLLWAELFQIHAICLWCTGVHILTFLLFVTLLFGLVLSEPES